MRMVVSLMCVNFCLYICFILCAVEVVVEAALMVELFLWFVTCALLKKWIFWSERCLVFEKG